MKRIRWLFLVALVAVAAFALVPAMAQGEKEGPVGRWNLRVGGQAGYPYLFDSVTGRVWRLEANAWSEIKRVPS
jgi:hypothetical protein